MSSSSTNKTQTLILTSLFGFTLGCLVFGFGLGFGIPPSSKTAYLTFVTNNNNNGGGNSPTLPPGSSPQPGGGSTSSAPTPPPGIANRGSPSNEGSSNSTGVLLISSTVSVYVPEQLCKPETCPPAVGDCVNNKCQYKNGYSGLKTYPKAYATQYCELGPDGCLGVTYVEKPYVTATKVSNTFGIPLCQGATSTPANKCVGITATPPMMMGNSQEAIDPSTGKVVRNWGLGLTEASGICHELTGPDGNVVVVATTDRCGGYCTCEALTSKQECGPCVNKNLLPGCPCVGTVGSLYSQCCGIAAYSCGTLDASCDWCASANHPHFDLDIATFNFVCASKKGAGSCELSHVKPVQCIEPVPWPPSAGGSASCGDQSWNCAGGGADPTHQKAIPGCSGCCCNWDKNPISGQCSCS
jgi:hypothetical protein